MKYGLVLALLIPILSWSQNCNLKTTRDPYTKEIKVSTGFFSLNTARGSIEATKSDIDFMFSLDGKCFDNTSNAAVFFEGSRLKTNFKNTGTMNCDGLFHFTFRNTNPSPTALQNLGSKKITSIRFKDNSGKETGVTLTPAQQQQFMDLVNCLINEAKKLAQ
ncbi:MAG: hypothetical protein E6H10_01895 [Bacteroidetes bacterium]|nr:MAG: hypothetical protein E6H10_01895 [Bacteroidota bacterium]